MPLARRPSTATAARHGPLPWSLSLLLSAALLAALVAGGGGGAGPPTAARRLLSAGSEAAPGTRGEYDLSWPLAGWEWGLFIVCAVSMFLVGDAEPARRGRARRAAGDTPCWRRAQAAPGGNRRAPVARRAPVLKEEHPWQKRGPWHQAAGQGGAEWPDPSRECQPRASASAPAAGAAAPAAPLTAAPAPPPRRPAAPASAAGCC